MESELNKAIREVLEIFGIKYEKVIGKWNVVGHLVTIVNEQKEELQNELKEKQDIIDGQNIAIDKLKKMHNKELDAVHIIKDKYRVGLDRRDGIISRAIKQTHKIRNEGNRLIGLFEGVLLALGKKDMLTVEPDEQGYMSELIDILDEVHNDKDETTD